MPLRIPITIPDEGHPFITIQIFWNGKGAAVNFVIDTGAFETSLSETDAKKLGAELKSLPRSDHPVFGVGGKSACFEMDNLMFIFLCDGNRTWELLVPKVMVIKNPDSEMKVDRKKGTYKEKKFPLPSLLGRDFLARHGIVLYWDFPNKNAYLDVVG